MSIFNCEKTILLDGAMGTMFQMHGMEPGEDSTAFALKNPDIVEKIQREYIEAGSDVILSPTFNMNRDKVKALAEAKTLEDVVREITGKLAGPSIKLRDEYRKKGREVYVSFDIGPQGELLEPMGTLSFEDAYEFYAEEAKAAMACGADFITIETMTDIYDTKAAVLAARDNTDLPVLATMSFEENGRTFVGCDIRTMALVLEGLGVSAIGINCSLGPAQILPLIKKLKTYTKLPVIAKPNAGLPDPSGNGYDISCEEFVSIMKEYIDAGVEILGGCCGTTPDYIRGIAEYIRETNANNSDNPALIASKSTGVASDGQLALSSGTKVVTVDHVAVIGERLNPTGKKKLKEALLAGDYDYLAKTALSQAEAGAEILDVNVGVPGLDEAKVMPEVIKKLQSVTNLPLQIDSSNPEAIEAGLRVYNGKAIVNSVNGDDEILDRVLPIVKKYGAAVIGLTLDSGGIPATCEERFAIAEKIMRRAMDYGLQKKDIIIDCLTLTASAQQKEVDETLKTVRKVSEELGLTTALGVSNVSFGLPLRPIINRTFLTMALENGLVLPIINPNDEDMMASVFAFNVLKNRDEGAAAFIGRYSDKEHAKSIVPKGTAKAMKAAVATSAASGISDGAAAGTAKPAGRTAETTEKSNDRNGNKQERPAGGTTEKSGEIDYAIRNGLEAETGKTVEKLLESLDPMAVVNDMLIPALDNVGKAFEKGDVFLPEMMRSAQAAQAGFEVIKRILTEKGAVKESRGDVVIATVKGDIHDIGKNIVKVIMENYGFNMIDLGRDVSPDIIVNTVIEKDIKLVGLSALMTTTLSSMEETIKALNEKAPDCRTMVGGAVLTEDYARKIGADFYCRDAMKSVEAAQKVFGNQE